MTVGRTSHKIGPATKNTMQIETKARRGRPSGSNSFVKIRLEDLVNMIGNQAIVPVSKVWLREMGYVTDEPAPAVTFTAAKEEVKEEPKIAFSFETFSED